MASKKKAAKNTGIKRAKVTFPREDVLALAHHFAGLNGVIPAGAEASKKFTYAGSDYTLTPSLKKTLQKFALSMGQDGPKLDATLKAYFAGKGKTATSKAQLLAHHGNTPKTVKLDKLGSIKVFCVGTWGEWVKPYQDRKVSVFYYSDRIEVRIPKVS
jgi:hypothetical protein